MGCYIIPAASAIIHYFMRKKNPSMNTKHHLWLNQLLLGGAIFGVVDHLWNGELFLFSISDLALGALITVVIFASWNIIVWRSNVRSDFTIPQSKQSKDF